MGVDDGGADVTPTVGEAGEPRRWARSTADDGRRPRMLWRPVMAEEDDKGGGDGGEIMGGGTNKDRVWFLRTFVVFLCKKTDKLLASC